MTAKRRDNHSTEFGLWLREQEDIDSKIGFIAQNIDYAWRNYKTGEWMFIEEKRKMSEPSFSQKETFKKINKVCCSDPDYKGFHLLQFENTSPDDGGTYLDGRKITKDQLIEFLQFKEAANG